MRLLFQINHKDRDDVLRASTYYCLLKELNSVIKTKNPAFILPEFAKCCDHDYHVVGKYNNGTFEIRCMKCADSYVIASWQP